MLKNALKSTSVVALCTALMTPPVLAQDAEENLEECTVTGPFPCVTENGVRVESAMELAKETLMPSEAEEGEQAETAPQEPETPAEPATPDAPAEKVVEEAQEATAPEEATTQIVTEATEAPKASPTQSARPPARRPTPPAPQVAEAPAETPKPETPKPETPKPEAPKPTPEPTTDKDAVAAALAEAMGETDAPATPAAPSGPPLSAGEKESLRVAVSSCWNVGSLSSEALRTTVVVSVAMNQDGTPQTNSIKMTSSSGGSQGAANQAFEAARRAIIRCGARGYQLPVEKFGQWQNIEMTFNPERMRIK